MSRTSPNLTLSLPKCRCCGRHWRPAEGVVADKAHCKKCARERQAVASSRLELKRITPADLSGRFLLPRRLRAS
jgi:hypothetical protein